MSRNKILITGYSGFIGSNFLNKLLTSNNFNNIILLGRKAPKIVNSNTTFIKFDDFRILKNLNFSFLKEVHTVYHLAGLAHKDNVDNQYDDVNVLFTKIIFNESLNFGVDKFLFLSSIGVNGSSSSDSANQMFNHSDIPRPDNPYSHSKLRAEKFLLSNSENIKLAILRPPLIYAKDAPGNFNKIANLLKRPIPLPVLGLKNKRSFLSILNLVDFLFHFLNTSNFSSGVYLIADKETISTAELLMQARKNYKIGALLFYIPSRLLRLFFSMIGKKDIFNKLSVTLIMNTERLENEFKWSPPYSLEETFK